MIRAPKKTAACLLAFSLGCAPEPPAPGPSAFDERLEAFVAARPTADRTALLVGINRYAPGTASAFDDLEGCVNDTLRMRDVLTDAFGFEDDDVFLLHDEDATHANIVKAFRSVLVDRSSSGTQAVFYLSGHGSRIPDTGTWVGAEPDRYDSTYLAYDSRTGDLDGEHDLADDELRSLVMALCDRTNDVLVVTDSCHSGGVLRGRVRGTRGAPPGTRPLDTQWLSSFWPESIEYTDDAASDPLDPSRYVHVAASRRDQLAREYEIEDESGRRVVHGALTWFLASGLVRARPTDTWRALIDDVAARVATEVPAQTVTHQGGIDRTIFGGRFDRVGGHPARATQGGRAVVIEAGTLFGLRTGSVLEILDARGEGTLGTVRVSQTTSAFARGEWLPPAPVEIPEGGLRAIEKSRPAGRPPLKLHVTDEALADELADSQWVEITNEATLAGYRIEAVEDGNLVLMTTEGVPASDPFPANDVKARDEAFRAELRWRSFFELATEGGGLRLDIAFRAANDEELADYPTYVATEIIDDDASELSAAGDENVAVGAYEGAKVKRMGAFEISNPNDIGVYYYVLSICEDRATNAIYPQPGRAPEFLPPGATTTVKASLFARRDWGLDRRMRDRYLAIATTQRADFSIFQTKGTMRSGGRPAPPLLELALERATERGGASAAVSRDGWGVTSLDLMIEKP